MKFKMQQEYWLCKHKAYLYYGSEKFYHSLAKVKGSIFAVMIGFIVGAIVIALSGKSIFTYFQYLLLYAFNNKVSPVWDNTLKWWSLYIIAGLALVVTFKTGIFNIGVSGQMLAAGAVILAFGRYCNLQQPLQLLIVLLLAIIVSMFVAFVTIMLRVFFNIHEVVTGILLNWIIWYLIKWIFTTNNELFNSTAITTATVNDNLSLRLGAYSFYLPLLLAISLVLLLAFLLKKTTFGYKIKTVGANPFAADYAGINRKVYSVMAFLLSGAIVGIMAFVFYVGLNPSISFVSDSLPIIGFDSISVALVGQNNVFGVVASAFLWAVIKSGGISGSVILRIPNAVNDLIFGVIIYAAACIILLARLKIFKLIVSYLNIALNPLLRQKFHHYLINMLQYRQIIKKYRKEQKNLIKESKKQAINNFDLATVTNYKKEQIQVCKIKIKQEWRDCKHFISKEYQNIWTSGVRGIKYEITRAKKGIYVSNLDSFIDAGNEYEKQLNKLKMQFQKELKMLLINQTKKCMIFGRDSKVTTTAALLKMQHQTEIQNLKRVLYQQFQTIIANEKNLLTTLRMRKTNLLIAYQAQKKLMISKFKKQKKEIIATYRQNIKQQPTIYHLNFNNNSKITYATNIKILKQKRKNEIKKLKSELLIAKANTYWLKVKGEK